MFFNPKIQKHDADIGLATHSYRIWNQKEENTKLFSTEVKLKGRFKQKKIYYYFSKAFHSTFTIKNTTQQNREAISCLLKTFEIYKIPSIIEDT